VPVKNHPLVQNTVSIGSDNRLVFVAEAVQLVSKGLGIT
jgi:hypothetical protein